MTYAFQRACNGSAVVPSQWSARHAGAFRFPEAECRDETHGRHDLNIKEFRVKKSILSLGLALVLALAGVSVQAAEMSGPQGNPVDQFTGSVWANTSESNKAAYLFGVESAITVEYFVNAKITEKSAKAGKRPVYCMSPFERGWMKAFKDVSRAEIVKMVDNWYAANPQSLDRPVLSVIWYELIMPRLAAAK